MDPNKGTVEHQQIMQAINPLPLDSLHSGKRSLSDHDHLFQAALISKSQHFLPQISMLWRGKWMSKARNNVLCGIVKVENDYDFEKQLLWCQF